MINILLELLIGYIRILIYLHLFQKLFQKIQKMSEVKLSERDLRAKRISAGSNYRLDNQKRNDRKNLPSWEYAVNSNNVILYKYYIDKFGNKRVRV